MPSYFATQADLEALLARLIAEGEVVAPVLDQGRNILQTVTAATIKDVNLAGYRTVEPYKSYVFKLTERVATYFTPSPAGQNRRLVLFGLRACDLSALDVYHKVMDEGEPAYLVVTADCTACGRTCFCNMVGGKPYAAAGFDLNITALENGYIIETGSPRGEQLLSPLPPATDDQLKLQAGVRNGTEAQLETVNQEFKCKCNINWTEAHRLNLENSKAWKEVTKKCVECSACNFICPSCTCFLLLDSRDEGSLGGARDERGTKDENSRHKVWDACLKNGYARVAGGANSRPKLFERLQNRYHCKFDYSPTRLGRYTCVGCGRCIDACAGNIDMREVYAELVRQVPLTAKLV
ncbi:MAG: 4Fe-4S dicluster domain-containing protein [Candidatus Margulisbacteria bacterium]|jgi:ferredoxin|nr:4Fe-4S dicluster domain-containing protein [Candidatus Margulisiibacteriota bacterium]